MNTQLGDIIMADKKDKAKKVDQSKKKEPAKNALAKATPKKK